MSITKPRIVSCSHIRPCLTQRELRAALRDAVAHLKPVIKQFDAIAFCGVSGALFAPLLAYRLNRPLIVVRKPEHEDAKILRTHSRHTVEGLLNTRSYLIVDDLISSGNTMRYIVKAVHKWQAFRGVGRFAVPFGAYLYNAHDCGGGDNSFVHPSRWKNVEEV